MRTIKCIVADCDGTILNSKGNIDTKLADTIQELYKLNIQFTLASGRSLHLMYDIIQALTIQIPFIADNGSSIYQYDKLISQSYIPNEYIEVIKNILIQAHVPFIIYGKSIIASFFGKPSLQFFKHNQNAPKHLISLETHGDYNAWQDIYKIVIDTSNMNHFERIAAFISEKCPFMLLERSEGYLYTCTSQSATKGNGLKKIAELLDISTENIMVFGDNYNDISMFKNAGMSVAMDNSFVQVKAYADAICLSNNHNGVSNYINHFLLHKN